MKSSLIQLELLSPARDLATGIAAIDSGADAVYIGPPGFGARADAGNSITDIAALVLHAHLFRAKVYATVNTILTDEQLPEAVALIGQLYEAGVDAVIIQDAGLLNYPLPPVPLHASTQFHNVTPQKVQFLQSKGIGRVILARELSLSEIAKIRAATDVELEFFVHGALCVSFSGQCYLSHALTGRSANRGECAQPCRSYYSLFDGNGMQLAADQHLLSLKDLNLSTHIHQLAQAGITSFKIEGRLKDVGYVRNITAWYSDLLDNFIAQNPGYKRASAGVSFPGFVPDPERSFNRGFTTYFIDGRQAAIHSPEGGKSAGKPVGVVRQVRRDHLVADLYEPIANGDGISFIDADGRQMGVRINRAQGNRLWPVSLDGLREGTQLFRNRDQVFDALLARTRSSRKLPVNVTLSETDGGISLTLSTLWGVEVTVTELIDKTAAHQDVLFVDFAKGQLSKFGNSVFIPEDVEISCRPLLIRASVLNSLRRNGIEQLTEALINSYSRPKPGVVSPAESYPERSLDFRGNVLNRWACEFYEKNGTQVDEAGFESGLPIEDKPLMTTRHCLRHAFGCCLLEGGVRENPDTDGSWWLKDNHHSYRLKFDCRQCQMQVSLPSDTEIVPLQAK